MIRKRLAIRGINQVISAWFDGSASAFQRHAQLVGSAFHMVLHTEKVATTTIMIY
jgi:hypothetical protein